MVSYAESACRRHLALQGAMLQLLATDGPRRASNLAATLSAAGHPIDPRGHAAAAHLRELRRDGLVERDAIGWWSVVAERCAGLAREAPPTVPAWQVEEWGIAG